MKKIQALTIAILAPSLLFAQSYAGDNTGATIVGCVIAAIALFFALRWVMLWYWKVSTIIENQAAQITEQKNTNELLRALLKQIMSKEESADI